MEMDTTFFWGLCVLGNRIDSHPGHGEEDNEGGGEKMHRSYPLPGLTIRRSKCQASIRSRLHWH